MRTITIEMMVVVLVTCHIYQVVLAHAFISFQMSANYQEFFLRQMIDFITDEQPEVRQAATYGIGVMAQFGGPVYADICAGKG